MFKSVHGHFNYSQNLMNSMRNELDWKNSGQRYSIFMATLRAIQLPHRWIIQLTTMISKKTQRWLQVQYLDLADSQYFKWSRKDAELGILSHFFYRSTFCTFCPHWTCTVHCSLPSYDHFTNFWSISFMHKNHPLLQSKCAGTWKGSFCTFQTCSQCSVFSVPGSDHICTLNFHLLPFSEFPIHLICGMRITISSI